ncbi:hypothetical protein Y032_0005g2258 [Ancylostoma ceylanicum]|uniref:Secreted protein n=1 Tax=Ancylostoma ceylanicum TaxID=53326 RepID=A0A016VQB1_9BILA|nr:hypothetical protein Y032_0005g2258 [Ancylostoma ceylanicum]
MLLIRSIFALIVFWRLNTVRKYRMPALSGDYYTIRVILPTSHPLLRILPSFVSEQTASTLLYVQADCYQLITFNKQGMINHFPRSFQVESVTYSHS